MHCKTKKHSYVLGSFLWLQGECVQAAQCDQPCTRARDSCAHPCLEPCHPGWPCPQTQCNFEVCDTMYRNYYVLFSTFV